MNIHEKIRLTGYFDREPYTSEEEVRSFFAARGGWPTSGPGREVLMAGDIDKMVAYAIAGRLHMSPPTHYVAFDGEDYDYADGYGEGSWEAVFRTVAGALEHAGAPSIWGPGWSEMGEGCVYVGGAETCRLIAGVLKKHPVVVYEGSVEENDYYREECRTTGPVGPGRSST